MATKNLIDRILSAVTLGIYTEKYCHQKQLSDRMSDVKVQNLSFPVLPNGFS